MREGGIVLGDVFATINVETLADMLTRESKSEVVAATRPLRVDQLLVEAGVLSANP